MKSHTILVMVAVLVIAVMASIGQGMSSDEPQKSAAAVPFSEQSEKSASIAAHVDGDSLVTVSASSKRKPVEVTCENPDVITSVPVTEAKRKELRDQGQANIDAAVTEGKLSSEEAVLAEAVLEENLPATEFSRAVYVDDASAVGDPPAPETDPDGSKFDAWAKKAKQVGCKSSPFRSTGGRLAAPALIASYPAGQRSCTNSHWTTNSVGQTLAKVTQTSKWYSNSQGLPSNPRKSYSISASWGWSTNGSVQGDGPDVTVSYGVPLQYYSWTGQNFHFKYFGITLYNWYGEVEHWFGFKNGYGPKCSIFWWYP